MAVKVTPVLEEPTLPCKEANEALTFAIVGLFCCSLIFGPIAISKASGSAIDSPGRNSEAVVHLLKGDSRGHHDVFHRRGISQSHFDIEFERFDQDTATAGRQARSNKGQGIVDCE